MGPVEEGNSPGTEPEGHRRIEADAVPGDSTAARVVVVVVVVGSSWGGHHSTGHHNHHCAGFPRSVNKCICWHACWSCCPCLAGL